MKSFDLGAVTAYAVAVKNGFKGTEQEWLDSLKGLGVPVPSVENIGKALIVNEDGTGYIFGNAGESSNWLAAEGEPGHVLNRTHYEETVVNEVEWLAEQTFMFAETGGKNLCSTVNPIGESIVAGVKYTVVFDGEHYECVAHSTGQNIGNMSLTNASAEDTGEPFRIATINAGAKLQMFATTDGEHTISIYKVSEETIVHKLPVKYLPNYIIELTDAQESGDWVMVPNVFAEDFADILYSGGSVLIKKTDEESGETTVFRPTSWKDMELPSGVSVLAVEIADNNNIVHSSVYNPLLLFAYTKTPPTT